MSAYTLAPPDDMIHIGYPLTCTQAATQEHILQNWAALKAQQAQEVNQYNQATLVNPTLKYLNETQQQHDKGLLPNITAVSDNLHWAHPQ